MGRKELPGEKRLGNTPDNIECGCPCLVQEDGIGKLIARKGGKLTKGVKGEDS